jgi:hypothetical protein
MAKKRTGLQSQIAGIFSGVPVPKKSGQRSVPGHPASKSDEPASKAGGPVMPKPAALRPMAPVPPMPQKPIEPVTPAARPKVTEIKVPEQKTGTTLPKISRRRKDKIYAQKAGVGSSRQKAAVVLLVLLSGALVIVLARPYFTSGRNPGVSRTTVKTDTANSARANIKIDWPIPPVYSANLRDPMELSPQKQTKIETTGGIVVRGITYSEDRKFAIIGIYTVEEGDIVPGTKIKVIKIYRNSVEFEEDGKTWEQQVEGEKK